MFGMGLRPAPFDRLRALVRAFMVSPRGELGCQNAHIRHGYAALVSL
jgi:hypothetical protein